MSYLYRQKVSAFLPDILPLLSGLPAFIMPPHFFLRALFPPPVFRHSGGTMLYIAPEIHRGEHFDEGSDVYSFAIVMWEMVTKQVHHSCAHVCVCVLARKCINIQQKQFSHIRASFTQKYPYQPIPTPPFLSSVSSPHSQTSPLHLFQG